jgi:hypothetical protein
MWSNAPRRRSERRGKNPFLAFDHLDRFLPIMEDGRFSLPGVSSEALLLSNIGKGRIPESGLSRLVTYEEFLDAAISGENRIGPRFWKSTAMQTSEIQRIGSHS